VIAEVINFLVSKPLNKHLLKSILQEFCAPHSELILYADVYWLSTSKVISRVWELTEEMKRLISSSGHYYSFPQVFKDDFKIKLAFMVDLFWYRNQLSLCFMAEKILCVI
jgi:hypothetical protein